MLGGQAKNGLKRLGGMLGKNDGFCYDWVSSQCGEKR